MNSWGKVNNSWGAKKSGWKYSNTSINNANQRFKSAQQKINEYIKEENFEKAVETAKKHLKGEARKKTLEYIYQKWLAYENDKYTISKAIKELFINRAQWIERELNVTLELILLNIEKLIRYEKYAEAIKLIQNLLKEKKITDLFTKKEINLKKEEIDRLTEELVKTIAQQLINDNNGDLKPGIEAVKKFLNAPKISKSAKKQLRVYRQQLLIQQESQKSAQKAIDYLNNNKPQILKDFGSGKQAEEMFNRQIIQLGLDHIKETKGSEAAYNKAIGKDFREKLEKLFGKKQTRKLIARLELGKTQEEQGAAAAEKFLNELKKENLFSEKEIEQLTINIELTKKSQEPEEALKYIEQYNTEIRELGMNPASMKIQYEFEQVRKYQGPAIALAFLTKNEGPLRKAGINIDVLKKELDIDIALAEGKPKEIQDFVEKIGNQKSRELFLKDLKEINPNVFNTLCTLIDANNLEDAKFFLSKLSKGTLPHRVLDSALSYISYLETAANLQLAIKVGNRPTALDGIFAKQPDSTEVAINPVYISPALKQGKSNVEQIQLMLSVVVDENGWPYLSGEQGKDWTLGNLDYATVIAISRFANRESGYVDLFQLIPGITQEQAKQAAKSEQTLVWTKENLEELAAAYYKFITTPHSISQVFNQTKLGFALKKAAYEKKVPHQSDFWTGGYLYAMLTYLQARLEIRAGKETDPKKLDQIKRDKESIVRLKKAMQDGKTLFLNKDLQRFFKLSQSVKIDEDAVSEKLEQYLAASLKLVKVDQLPKAFRMPHNNVIEMDQKEFYKPLYLGLQNNDIAKELINMAKIKQLKDPKFNIIGYVFCLLQYMQKMDSANQKAYQRIEKALGGKGDIDLEDLKILGEKITKVSLDLELLEELMDSWIASPLYIPNGVKIPTILLLGNGGFKPVDQKEQAKALENAKKFQYAQITSYRPAKAATWHKLYSWKKLLLDSGIPLESNQAGDIIISEYLTPGDLDAIVEFMRKNSSAPYLQYNLVLDLKLTEHFKGLYEKLPEGKIKQLIDKLLSSNLVWVLKKREKELSAKKELKPEGQKQLKLIQNLLKNESTLYLKAYSIAHKKEETAWKKGLADSFGPEETAYLKKILKELNNKKILISEDEQEILAKILTEAPANVVENLKALIMNIKPVNPGSFNEDELESLSKLAKALRKKGENLTPKSLDYSCKFTRNSGAQAIYERMEIGALGVQEQQREFYELAPVINNTGMQGKPQLAVLKFVKAQWAKEVKLDEKAFKIQDQIDELNEKIKVTKDPKELAPLLSQLKSLEQSLDGLLTLIDGDTIPQEFLVWFVNKYVKNRDWADQIAALSNEYLYFEYYTDIVTGKKMNLENACDILLKADAILKQYLPQWESRGVLYTLDPTGEGEKLSPEAREMVIIVKQAFSAAINLLFPATKIAKKGNQGESKQSEALQNLKLQTASYYNQFYKGRDMRKYLNYVFGDNPGLGGFNKLDVEILSELMKYSQIKDIETILAKLNALKENEDAWDSNGTLKKGHEGEEILEDLSMKMYQGDDTTYHVGNPGNIIAAMKEAGGFLNYILPLTDAEWVENFKKNMGDDWGSKLFDEIFSANFAKELGCQFLFQQVMFRYLMLKYIYWDLGGEMIDGLLNGDLTSLKHLPALLVWQRFVFIWYRDFWKELGQGNIGNALAIFYAINYLTFRGGWQSIWGKTLTLDAEMLKALCKVPGLEKGFSYLNKRFPRFEKAMKAWSRGFLRSGLETEWFRKKTPTFQKLSIKPEDTKKVRFIKGALKNLLKGTLISPWLALEDGARSLAQQDGKIRHAAKIWTWPMDYLFGLGEAGFDLGIRGIKYPFKKGYQFLNSTGKALAKGESPWLNPIDIKAEVEIIKGTIYGNTFEKKGNADLLVKLLKQAKKATGDLAALAYDKKNGKFIIKKTFKIEVDGKIEEKTYSLEVVKVRTVEGIKEPKFVVVIPYGASEADYKVWLHLPEDFNRNTLQAAVNEFKTAEFKKPEEVNDMPKLEGKPLDAKANEALLEQVKLPAKEARADGLEIVKQYANDHKGFWEKFKQNYLDLKAGKIDIHEFRPWETAAYKIATIDPQNNLPEGKTLRLVQMQAITLLGAGENTLLQFGTGEGKTTVALLSALEAAAKGEKVYIFTTGDSLVKQFETGEDKPLLEMLKKAGLKVGLLTSEITDPDKRAKIYQESNVIIMDIASHAFDLSKGEIPKGVIKPGFVIADEWDLYSIETAATSYTIANQKGLTGNFIIDGSNWIRLQWKWKANANQTFKKLLKANEKLIKQNKSGEDLYLDEKGRYTKKGIEFIKKNYSLIPGRKVPYSSFIQKQFESLAKAWTLFNEKTDQEERKKLESQGKSLLSSQIKFRFKYNEKGRITGIIPMEESGEESPNKKFGWGLDEALRAVSSLWIEGETVTLSDIDILQVYKHHNSLMGLSGSMGAAHEIAKVAYGEDFDFRVVEIPSFIPKLVLTPDDLANLAKPQVQEKIDKWIKAVKEVAELGDTGAPSKKTYAKIVLQGIEPDSLELKSFLDQAVKAIGNRKIAIVHHEKIFILEKKARVKAAVAEVIEKAASQRPTFVSLETEEEFKDFKELLKNAGVKFQTFTGEDFADNKKEIEKIEAEIKKSGECKMGDYIFKKEGLLKKLVAYKNEDGKLVKVPEKEIQEIIREAKMSQAGELGMVTLSYFSRGLDIQAKTALDQLLETASEKAEKLAAAEAEAAPKIAQGGLHVISLGAGTEAKIIQQIGRTARSYHPGSATVYTGKGDALYQIYKEETEALEKLVKGHEGEAFSLYDPQNQELIEKVNEVFKKGYQKNFEALLDTFKYSEMKYKLLNLMNNLSSNAAAPLKFAEIAIKAHVELLLKKYGVEDGKPLSAEVKAQLEKELGKMLGKRKVTFEISAGKINAKALANIMARRIMKLFTSLRQGDVNNPVTNPKYPTCAGASCSEISKMTIELQTITGETYAEVIEELEKLNHLDTANMGRDFIEKEMERVVGRAKGALLAKLFKNWFPNKTPLLGSQAIKNAARPGTGSIVITDAGSDPKTGDLVFKFTGKERKKLRKTGAFLKDGVLFLFNKSVSEFPYRAVDLNGLSCKKIKKGTYEFSYDGKKQIYSAAQIWKALSTGRKILGVEVTIRSADSKLALPEPAGTVSSGPIIPLQSVFKLSLGDVIPAPEAEVEFQKIDPAKVDNLQDLIAEIKKVADEDALLLFESKGTVKIRGRAKDFKAWKNSLKSAQELLLYLKSTGQVDKYSKITAMLTKHHLKEAELQYKLFGEEAKITVEIDGEKIEVPAKLVADIQRGKKALARIREAIIKANPDLSPAYIDNVIKANAPDIFAKIDKSSKKYLKFEVARMTVAGTKAQLLELLDTVKVEITLEDGKKLLIAVNNQDAKDFLSNDPGLQEKARQNIIKKIGEIAEDAEIGDVFKILKPEQVLDQLKLQMKTLRTNLEASQFAQQKLMQKQVEFQQQELKKIQKQLKKADSQEGFELLEKASIKAAMAVEAYRLTFENMLNNHFASSGKKTISKDELEKIWKEAETEMAKIEGQDLLSQKKYLEYLKKGMPGANKVAKIGHRTVKDGILGLSVGLVLETGTELGNLLAGEGFDFAKVLKNTGEQGLHWARFGLMAGASEHLLGWSESLSMYGAMVIPALWDLGNPDLPFEMKGQVFVQHALGLGGFIGGMGLAKRGIAPKFPKVGGWATLAFGMASAWGLGKLHNEIYAASESYRSIVDSKVMNSIGSFLGGTSDYVTVAWGSSLAASGLASIGTTLVELDALGSAFGIEASFGGASTFFSRGASIISRAAGPLIVLGLCKGFFSTLYDISNSDYEKVIAQRLGNRMWNKTCDNTEAGCWAAEAIGGEFKFDQQVEGFAEWLNKVNMERKKWTGGMDPVYYKHEGPDPIYLYLKTPPQYYPKAADLEDAFVTNTIETVAKDFSDSLSLAGSIPGNFNLSALDFILKNITGNVENDYESALNFVQSQVQPLTQPVSLNEYEQKIYKAVLENLKGTTGFDDPKLIGIVKNFYIDEFHYGDGPDSLDNDCDGSEECENMADEPLMSAEEATVKAIAKAKGLLKKFKILFYHNNVNYISLINPQDMGKELYEYLNFYVNEAPKINRQNSAKKATLWKNFKKQHPEIAKKIEEKKQLNPLEHDIFFKEYGLPSANIPQNIQNPFEDTAIMKMAKVQKAHDTFAKFFDSTGRLLPDKAKAFAKWILSKKIHGIKQENLKWMNGKTLKQILEEYPKRLKENRANYLLAATLGAERMFELVRMYLDQGTIQPTDDDIKMGLVRKNSLTGNWEINPENPIHKAWGDCKAVPENVHLVVAKLANPTDVKLGLVDENGYLDLDNPYIKKVFGPVQKNIFKTAAKQGKKIEKEFQEAEANLKEWQENYANFMGYQLNYTKQYGILLENGESTENIEKKLAWAAKNLNLIMKKKLPKAMRLHAEAQGQLAGLKITIITLQIQYLKGTDPLKKEILAAQIKGFGGSIENITPKYVDTATKILELLQTPELKKDPKLFAEYINKLLNLEKSSKELELAKT